MPLLKCKMCGGNLQVEEGQTVCECEYCGTKQTVPKLNSDKKLNLFDRANHFRRNNEFDKAIGIYEQILNEDPTDAEAYWSLVLCRYGIEYVEDPATHKRIPTVNRTQYTSIFADEDYKKALEYASVDQKVILKEEAKAIDDIQKGILKISSQEEPFDVFICYKETDENGRRTQDSVLANELYYQLKNLGYKTFFSRITLEDKIGSAYEPYIFAALNSAKVMVVIGTRPEYFNAVWVKNEWSRFLAQIKKGEKKVLIPAYRDMDPYDLPEEFSYLQALDMSRLGFMFDLIGGIEKILKADKKQEKQQAEPSNSNNAPNIDGLLKRAFIYLEDGNWQEANNYCERVLDQDPENAQAYLGKLMAELHVHKQDDLANCEIPFDKNGNYQKAIRFGGEKMVLLLNGYISAINKHNEEKKLYEAYVNAIQLMNEADSESKLRNAAEAFRKVSGYKDADSLAEECLCKAKDFERKAEESKKDEVYASALSHMTKKTIREYEKAIQILKTIPGWKDSDNQVENCEKSIEEIKIKEENERQERKRKAEERRETTKNATKGIKKIALFVIPVLACTLMIMFVIPNMIPNMKYNSAIRLYEKGKYEEAIKAFEELEDYKDSLEKVKSVKHDYAVLDLLEKGDYDKAYETLKEIGEFDVIRESKYNRSLALIESGDYITAHDFLCEIKPFNYKDCVDILADIMPEYRKSLFKNAEVGSYVLFGSYEQDNDTTNGKEDIEWIVLEKEENKLFVISRYVLDCKPYNTTYKSVTWETCTLRKWLNNYFIKTAFISDEQNRIQSTKVKAEKNPSFDTKVGRDTNDRVFLLSIQEVQEYYALVDEWVATKYAIHNGATRTPFWWLRSPGADSYRAAIVDARYDIGIEPYGYDIVSEGYADHDNTDSYVGLGAVRPVLWITIEP